MSMLKVRVAEVEQVTDAIKHFVLVQENGETLPRFSGGSHIVVSMNINGRVHRNPYSLLGSTDDTASYHIGVRKQEHSRGGSVYMHEKVEPGTVLEITYPVNLFAISKIGHKHILVAGGIGITPFMSQISDLNRQGGNYELHYACRAREHAAFLEQLQEMCGDRLHCYLNSEGGALDLHELLGKQPLGTHVYVCGPDSMVTGLLHTAKTLGWPDNHVHSEQFSAPPIGDEFTIQLASTGQEVVVPGEMSMLEAMEDAGIDAPYLCRGGACGRCELEVVSCDGVIEHNDHYLSDHEKIQGKSILPCVSRAKCSKLVLNF